MIESSLGLSRYIAGNVTGSQALHSLALLLYWLKRDLLDCRATAFVVDQIYE